MAVKLNTYIAQSNAAGELYITATPGANASVHRQAEEIFSEIRQLISKKARIFQERVFCTPNTADKIAKIRSKIYGDIDDGVTPAFLVGKKGSDGPIAGVQVHAIISAEKPQVITIDGKKSGRVIRVPGKTYLSLSGITTPEFDNPEEQAEAMLEKGQAAIKQFNSNFLAVPRTWMWLGDILSWYSRFNKVRNAFFVGCGILGENSRRLMPASTGIGLAPADGGKCAMDLTVVIEPPDAIEYYQVVGRQQCAFDYGSAFSRASQAITPAGKTVFVSGTASIDAAGATANIDDPYAQIIATIENVQAVLRDTNCTDADVVQIMAYCKTTEVEKVFNEIKDKPDWPWVTIICDICRRDLLFEIEALAVPKS